MNIDEAKAFGEKIIEARNMCADFDLFLHKLKNVSLIMAIVQVDCKYAIIAHPELSAKDIEEFVNILYQDRERCGLLSTLLNLIPIPPPNVE